MKMLTHRCRRKTWNYVELCSLWRQLDDIRIWLGIKPKNSLTTYYVGVCSRRRAPHESRRKLDLLANAKMMAAGKRWIHYRLGTYSPTFGAVVNDTTEVDNSTLHITHSTRGGIVHWLTLSLFEVERLDSVRGGARNFWMFLCRAKLKWSNLHIH